MLSLLYCWLLGLLSVFLVLYVNKIVRSLYVWQFDVRSHFFDVIYCTRSIVWDSECSPAGVLALWGFHSCYSCVGGGCCVCITNQSNIETFRQEMAYYYLHGHSSSV